MDTGKKFLDLEGSVEKLFDFVIRMAFEQSKFLKEKTNMTPSFAFETFGKDFKVVEIDTEMIPTGMINGVEIKGSFDEALKILVERHPMGYVIFKNPESNHIYYDMYKNPKLEQRFDYDFGKIRNLPCEGIEFKTGRFDRDLVYIWDGNISKEFLSTYSEVSQDSVSLLLTSIINKDKETLDKLQRDLFKLAEKAYTASRQLIGWKTEKKSLPEEMYPSMEGLKYEEHEPELCRICLEDRYGSCQFLKNEQERRKKEWEEENTKRLLKKQKEDGCMDCEYFKFIRGGTCEYPDLINNIQQYMHHIPFDYVFDKLCKGNWKKIREINN